jgi:hypothetical protein
MIRAGLVALALLLAPAGARAEAVLDVSGSVVSTFPRLEVRVVVTNRGDRPATPLGVEGELFGERRSARLAAGVPPGGSGAVRLDFAPEVPRPGLHALKLLLEHPVEGPPDGAGNPPVSSRRAWLLLALGAAPSPSVRLSADPLHLEVRGDLVVRVESADGEPHRVHLRALTARGLRADGEGVEVAVPATGVATVGLPLVRAGAPRGSRHAVLLVAESLDGDLARTAVLAPSPWPSRAGPWVEVAADPSVLPRVRGAVLALGLLLLAVAVGFEVRRWRAGSGREQA